MSPASGVYVTLPSWCGCFHAQVSVRSVHSSSSPAAFLRTFTRVT